VEALVARLLAAAAHANRPVAERGDLELGLIALHIERGLGGAVGHHR
jgi:hypothetical protein